MIGLVLGMPFIFLFAFDHFEILSVVSLGVFALLAAPIFLQLFFTVIWIIAVPFRKSVLYSRREEELTHEEHPGSFWGLLLRPIGRDARTMRLLSVIGLFYLLSTASEFTEFSAEATGEVGEGAGSLAVVPGENLSYALAHRIEPPPLLVRPARLIGLFLTVSPRRRSPDRAAR